jgi:hypothetical protein
MNYINRIGLLLTLRRAVGEMCPFFMSVYEVIGLIDSYFYKHIVLNGKYDKELQQ